MKIRAFRLGEYKIIEHDSEDLRWETHFGIGELKEGRCFKKGSILFIGPAENDRPGFLKLEFIEELEKLPDWTKTKYYCSGFEVYHCRSNQTVKKEDMQIWTLMKNRIEKEKKNSERTNRQDDVSFMPESKDRAFQLNRYEIVKKKDGRIIWNRFRNPNNIGKGECVILEDILFLKPPLNRRHAKIKEQFSVRLQDLPKWDQTSYYCPKYSLHECVKKTLGDKKIGLSDTGLSKKDSVTKELQDSNNANVIVDAGVSYADLSSTVEKNSRLGADRGPATPLNQSGQAYSSTTGVSGQPGMSSSMETAQVADSKKWSFLILMIFAIILCVAVLINTGKEYNDNLHSQKIGHHSSHSR